MNFDVLKYIGSGAKMMSLLPLNFLLGKAKGDYPIRTNAAWDEEKDDILERANWLCEQVIKTPEELIADVIEHIEDYQALVDKNRETAEKLGSWDVRMKWLMGELTEYYQI